MPTANVARPGDTVLIAYTVPEQSLDQNDGSYLTVVSADGHKRYISFGQEVHSIIKPPRPLKVGDIVKYIHGSSHYKLIGVCDGRSYIKAPNGGALYESNKNAKLELVTTCVD